MSKFKNKWLISITVLTISIFILSGCNISDLWTNKYEEDYTQTYKELLDYTLGDWKVIKSEKAHYTSKNENEMSKDYITWDIQYKDKSGKEQILHLRNDYDMGENLIDHTEKLLKNEFEKEIEKPQVFYLRDPYLITSWSDSTKSYREHPEVLTENYKDSFKFNDFSFNTPFKNSPIYLSLHFDYKDDNLTDVEKVKKWEETRNKILTLSPNINMKVDIKVNETLKVSLLYVKGEDVGKVDYETFIRNEYRQFNETDLVKEK